MRDKSFWIAAGVGAFGALLVWFYCQRFEQKVTGGRIVPVLVATQDIPMGVAVSRAMLGIRDVPEKYVENRHIRASETTRVVGVRISTAVRAGESVLWTDLATSYDQRRDLAQLVQAGMRAVTIPVDSSSSFGGLLRPGDRVDVLYASMNQGSKLVSLLQNTLIMAVGQNMGAAAGPQGNSGGSYGQQVTLSVTLEQAQILAYAKQSGVLTLTLRNPDDVAVIKEMPETTADDLMMAQKRAVLLNRVKTGLEIEHVK